MSLTSLTSSRSPIQKLFALLLLSSLPAAAVACATGTTTSDVTADISLTTEADAAADASSTTRLPPANDASAALDATNPDATSSADASPAADGADDAAATDAALIPDSSSTTSAACGAGFVQVGEYATWYGKVNVHRAGSSGTWSVDTDCTSGADVNTVAYCQKFWPATTTQTQLAAVTADNKPFTSGGGVSPACGGVALHPGQSQFVCCAP
jgi:hypothetical protein